MTAKHQPTTKRNTWQKDAVRHALNEVKGFMSAQELHQVLKNHGSTIGLATVYRALADLAEAGEADSLQAAAGQPNAGETLYRACGDSHHHHLICRDCGTTVEIAATTVEKWAQVIAEENGFTQASHTIEIFGTCAKCSK
jgi:Fur family ferric uptake transcriptional regulator